MINPNYQAEQAVIGDILLEPDKVMPIASQKLSPEDFNGEYRTLYQACKTLYAQNKPIDYVTVLAIVGEEYKTVFLTACKETPTICNYENYISIVRETANKRRAWNDAASLLDELENGEIKESERLATNISQYLVDKDFSDSLNASEGFMKFCESKDKPKNYIKTGISKLDRLTYIDKGDYVIFGGRPSSGKTAFTLQTMMNMAKERKVVYFSLETSKEKVFDRLISNYTNTSFSEIKQGTIQNWTPIIESYDTFSKLNFEIVAAAGWTVDQIKAKAIQSKAEVIYIDYLTLIKADGKNKLEQTTNTSIAIHTMAQQCGITVIALSQLNRGGEKELDMTALRESGQIEQDADCILLLQSTDPKEPCADRELIIAKNKEGEVGKLVLSFDGLHQKFYERESRYD
jgi:replicative DNA helicase